mmetsp:Transcript_26655/g.25525  ORF Transcript_26655/g.25525 Transcript_26655/m.25525 type:complete len:385 (+) Transcript_26655:121-1275(+)
MDIEAKALRVNSTMKGDGKCQICGAADFDSRNKLMKHVKVCQRLTNQTQILESVDLTPICNDKYIYVTGGRCRGRTLGSVERFSLNLRRWESCIHMLENRGSHGAAAIDNLLFVFGGGGFRSNLATCEMFDSSLHLWKAVAPLKTFRHALVVFSMSVTPEFFSNQQTVIPVQDIHHRHCLKGPMNLIFAIGGWIDGSVCSSDVEVYDHLTDTWTVCAPMAVPRRLLGASSYKNQIFVFGGNCDDGIWFTSAVECYDFASNSWTRKLDLPFSTSTSAITIGNFIYVLLHGKRIMRYCPSSDTYTALSELPLKEWFCFDVTMLGCIIYIHGGVAQGDATKAFFAYDIRTDKWKEMPPMLFPRRRCAAAIMSVQQPPIAIATQTVLI